MTSKIMWRRAIATILACPSYDFSKYKVPSTIWDKFGLVPVRLRGQRSFDQ